MYQSISEKISLIITYILIKMVKMKEQILLRLSKSDKDFLQEQADKKRLPLSTYVRATILSQDT